MTQPLFVLDSFLFQLSERKFPVYNYVYILYLHNVDIRILCSHLRLHGRMFLCGIL